MPQLNMYAGDLEPDLAITCSDRFRDVNLDDADDVKVIGKIGGVEVFRRDPSNLVVGDDSTLVVMQWQAGDTTRVGKMTVAVLVTWPGSKPETFAPEDHVVFKAAI